MKSAFGSSRSKKNDDDEEDDRPDQPVEHGEETRAREMHRAESGASERTGSFLPSAPTPPSRS